jgi:hypothetical protein
MGIPAEDYDIQNNFGETDHIIDLFGEIDREYNYLTRQDKTRQDKTRQDKTLFDTIESCQDLVIAFFPCIHFCDAKTMIFKGEHIAQKKWSMEKIMETNIENAQIRQEFYERLMQLVFICCKLKIRLIIENPWNTSRETYLQTNFIKPSLIDTNRTLRGDYFVKPTAYWYFNAEPTYGYSYQKDKEVRIVYKQKDKNYQKGRCSEERSMISPDYARNFICDFILGKEQKISQPCFDF